MKRLLLLVLHIVCLTSAIHAYNLRQINSKDGLSNSAVTCLLQDNKRFLWIGTFDGLNIYNSHEINVYKPNVDNVNSLSSNIIKNMVEIDSSYLWVNTKYGLNKFSLQTNEVEEFHPEFGEYSYIAKDSKENLFVSGKPNILSFYCKRTSRFFSLPTHSGMVHDNISNLFVDLHDTIWIHNNRRLERYTVSYGNSDIPVLTRHVDFPHLHPIHYSFYDDGKMIFVDSEGDLYCVTSKGIRFVQHLHELIERNGKIGSIIFDGEDLFVGFKTNGLIRLNAAHNYAIDVVDVNCGVFALCKDKEQDIIWIGTDGQGVYAYTKDEYAYHNIALHQIPINKKRPVRAIYADSENTLWLGTKENGVIRIKDYDKAPEEYEDKSITHFTKKDGLADNAIFTFSANNSHSVLWIGSDGPGLNYYSYKDNRIHTLNTPASVRIAGVHSMLEEGDSLLWVGAGSSLLKITVEYQPERVVVKHIRPFHFHISDKIQYNQIYAVCAESDSILWIGMRGNGAVRLNTVTEKYQRIDFKKKGIIPMNDILCIYRDKRGHIWMGTSYGLTKIDKCSDGSIEYENYNEADGLLNNTIHGILEDERGNLCLSTNAGIVIFNPQFHTFRILNHKNGLETVEFCDNAYYWDAATKRCFFGGVDGLVWLANTDAETTCFLPDIYFTRLQIFDQVYKISEFVQQRSERKTIILNHDQNFFSISFVAVDFIDGENGRYSYKLENFSNVWMDTESHQAQFTNIPPGEYVLKVRYDNGLGLNRQLCNGIHILVRAPWYQTKIAYLVYMLIFAGSVWGIFYFTRWKYEQRKKIITQRLENKYKEEMYEGKLRFFTNITHEFCTPLALICGPCERILNYEHSDSFIKKYVQIIKSNSERLNSLIQEVIDFRRVETGNQICRIQRLDITGMADGIISSFSELAEQNGIRIQKEVEQELFWNTDANCFSKILNNLISNAFKYTSKNGVIRISIFKEETQLQISVYNTGKGIAAENIPSIFNRYVVLDNIRENCIKGLSSRNGLGLAICQSMVKLLKGEIRIESEVGKYAEFIVTLPSVETEPSVSVQEIRGDNNGLAVQSLPDSFSSLSSESFGENGDKSAAEATVLVIDDNKDVLWLLKDVLSDEYNVLTATDGEEALRMIKQQTPDLIVTDVMMPVVDGLVLTKKLKSNPHTLTIPLIILSAKNSIDVKIQGIEFGADAYISKPFDIVYLKTVIRHLIEKRKQVKQYYHSSASNFEFNKGKLISKEDKDFLLHAIQIVGEHMDDQLFGTDELAVALCMSSRNLYRKLKELEQPSPNDFIKEQRISYAATLLLTTKCTIQEIMYRTAFVNRSHFYKEFAKRYRQTPGEYRKNNRCQEDTLN